MGQFCTSSIEVERSDGRISVTYFVDHVDHDINLGRKNIYKRIHAVVGFRKNKCQQTKPKDATDSVVEEKQEKIRNEILYNLVPKCEDVKDLQVLHSVEELVTKAIALLDAGARCPTDITEFPIKEPSNKNSVKQDKLYSTRKKRKQTDEGAGFKSTRKKRKQADEGAGFKKPSTKTRREIPDTLIKGEGDILVPVKSDGDIEYILVPIKSEVDTEYEDGYSLQ